MENVQECGCSHMERVGDSTGVWEGPAPPSKLL